MKAAVFREPGKPLTIEDVEIDKPRGKEVLVKTVAAGVCHSDLHFVEGLYQYATPAVLGHESAGIVEAVGEDVTYVKPGDHVIACLTVFCGSCEQCLSGRPNLCLNRAATQRDPSGVPRLRLGSEMVHQFMDIGGYAEKMLLHENAVVKVREDIPLDRAALIGCAVTTGLGAVFNTAKVHPGSSVAVFGCGGVGLAVVQGARIAGARQIIAIDVFEHKLEAAKKFGATDTVVATATDNPVRKIRELSGGGVEYSFEAIGKKTTAEQAFYCLAPGGVATIIGMVPGKDKIEIDGRHFLAEKKIQGTFMGSTRHRIDIPRYVDFYLQGRLNLDDMVSRRRSLEEINEAFESMKAGEVVRTVLTFN